jgi:hypothetical protein
MLELDYCAKALLFFDAHKAVTKQRARARARAKSKGKGPRAKGPSVSCFVFYVPCFKNCFLLPHHPPAASSQQPAGQQASSGSGPWEWEDRDIAHCILHIPARRSNHTPKRAAAAHSMHFRDPRAAAHELLKSQSNTQHPMHCHCARPLRTQRNPQNPRLQASPYQN